MTGDATATALAEALERSHMLRQYTYYFDENRRCKDIPVESIVHVTQKDLAAEWAAAILAAEPRLTLKADPDPQRAFDLLTAEMQKMQYRLAEQERLAAIGAARGLHRPQPRFGTDLVDCSCGWEASRAGVLFWFEHTTDAIDAALEAK